MPGAEWDGCVGSSPPKALPPAALQRFRRVVPIGTSVEVPTGAALALVKYWIPSSPTGSVLLSKRPLTYAYSATDTGMRTGTRTQQFKGA